MIKKTERKRMIKIGVVVSILLIILASSQSDFFLRSKIYRYISQVSSEFANIISGVLVLNTNSYRLNNNEKILVVNQKLTDAAQMKADDMARRGYFSHIGPDGERPWTWFEKVGYKYEYAGENLAVDFTESDNVSQAWIDSAGHKANLLNSNFTEIGIGVADGVYQGRNTTFVVQFFGKPYTEIAQRQTEETKTITIPTVELKTTSDPNTAIATRKGLSFGEVLGTEDVPIKIDKPLMLIFVTTVLLILIIIGMYYKKSRKP